VLAVQVLIAGGTGTGKSVLAAELWRSYRVSGIVNTGDIREAIRAVTDATSHPELFDDTANGESAVDRYRQQASTIVRATGSVLRRLASPMTLSGAEGMHLLPPVLTNLDPDATFVVVLRQPDRTTHEARLIERAEREGRREWTKYAAMFDGIRAIGEEIERTWAAVSAGNVHLVASVDEGLATIKAAAAAFQR
jgi:2-phosphoglycerate kinase